MSGRPFVIRNAEVGGVAGLDVRILEGRIAEVGPRLAGTSDDWDARGGAVIPGLIDHHIHLLATAARAESLSLEDVRDATEFSSRLNARLASLPPGGWVRAIGYHERTAGLLDRRDLDAHSPRHPIRIQHQTGALWMLNSAALDLVAPDFAAGDDAPEGLERDMDGSPTGRIWRADAWLRERIGNIPPPLAPLGARLASLGVTGVMDASVSTDASAAALLAGAVHAGDLPQRLGLMSGGRLEAPVDGAFLVGPVKILLDDHDLPALDDILDRIGLARTWGRAVAVHCVTAGELALTLAAFTEAGSRPGDRIEHGGMIPAEAIPTLAALGLTVVTQPGFVFERGDRYLDDIPATEHRDLYRCATLIDAGVRVAGSSDAPYATPDPWLAMRAAARRITRDGRVVAPSERVPAARALALFTGDFQDPGGASRRVVAGAAADLCILKTPLREALASLTPECVAATVVAGRVVHAAV